MYAIIRRELGDVLSSPKAAAARLILAFACSLLVLLRWPTGEVSELSGERSLQVLRIFGYGTLAGVLLLVPAFPATSLVREKVKGTLALLLNSPLSAWSIYLGKLVGSLGFAAILLLMTLPAAAACQAMGGTVVRGGTLALYGVLALAIIQISTLGLFVSSRMNSPSAALRLTYALVLLGSIVAVVPHILLRNEGGLLANVTEWVRSLSPLPAVAEILGQGDVASLGFAIGSGAVFQYVVVALLTCGLFAVGTVARLNYAIFDRARPPGVMTQDLSGGSQLLRRFLYLVDPQRRSEGMSLWVNPVMVKEFRSRRFGRSSWVVRLVFLSAILSLGLSYLAAEGALGWGLEVIGGALVLLQATLLLLFTPSLASSLISSERETGTWRLLQMTPLSPRRILTGKLLSVASPIALLLTATLPGYLVMMSLEPALIPRVGRVVICLGMMAIFAVLLSAVVGTYFRSTAEATMASYVVLIVVCIGPLLVWLGREAPFGFATVEAALMISPLAAALHASAFPGFSHYELLPANAWIIGVASLILLVVLVWRTRKLYRPD